VLALLAAATGTTANAKTSKMTKSYVLAGCAPSPAPDGKYTGNATEPEHDFNSSVAGWLVGGVEMTNTGNIDIVIHGKVTWKQAGAGPIVKVKTKRIKPGHTKVAHSRIRLTRRVSRPTSRPRPLNGKACSIKATIIKTFGQAPGLGRRHVLR
jgi:hypothetical protein